MNLEDELRSALRRESAPPNFKAKVLARVPQARRPWLPPPIAAGIALAVLIPLGASEYHRREQARAIKARDDLATALRITQSKLQRTRERIQRSTRHAL